LPARLDWPRFLVDNFATVGTGNNQPVQFFVRDLTRIRRLAQFARSGDHSLWVDPRTANSAPDTDEHLAVDVSSVGSCGLPEAVAQLIGMSLTVIVCIFAPLSGSILVQTRPIVKHAPIIPHMSH